MRSNYLLLKSVVAKVVLVALAVALALSSCTTAKNESIVSSSDNTSSQATSSKTVSEDKKAAVSSKKNKVTTAVSSKATQSSSSATALTSSTPKPTTTAEADKYDIMAIGSSNIYRYFIPAVIYEQQGYTSQVVATASTIGPMLKYLIAETAVRYNPDLFVVDLRWFVKYQKEPPNGSKIIKQNLNAIKRIKTKSIRERAAKDILKVFGMDQNMTTAQLKEKYPEWFTISEEDKLFNDSDLLKGYKPSSNVAKFPKMDYSKFNESTPLYVNTENRLRSLLEFCQSNNYNVLFTLTPFVASEQSMKYCNSVSAILSSYGYTLLDFNKISNTVGFDYSKDFYNNLHANTNGAVKFSSYIGKYISKKYEITTSSSDSIKSEWSKITEYWDEKYQNITNKFNEKLSKLK